VAGDVNADNEQDLVVGNNPENVSADWGFFVIDNVPNQSGQLFAKPFVQTNIRPLAIHLEDATVDKPARIVVFGELGEAAQVEIYSYSEDQDAFIIDLEQEGAPVPVEQSAFWGILTGTESALATTGRFDADEVADIAVAAGSTLYISRCSPTGCLPFVPLQLADGDGTLPADEIRLIASYESKLTNPSYQYVSDGPDALLVAGNGHLRWLTYGFKNATGGPAWRSISEFESFVPGTMSNMRAAAIGTLGGGFDGFALAGGDGAVDFTSFQSAFTDPNQPIEPAVRNRFPDQGETAVDVAIGDLTGDAQLEMAVLSKNPGDNAVTVYIDVAPDAGTPPVTGDGDPVWAAEPRQSLSPGFEASYLEVTPTREILIFASDGQCECWQVAPTRTTLEACKSGIVCLQE
jgi:hypothetical protein